MNVTVVIPKPLQSACGGRAVVELGVPARADIADILDTLLLLYPGLRAYVANEERPLTAHFGVAHQGHTVFLFATRAKPPQLPIRQV